jgi:hypothetical protein
MITGILLTWTVCIKGPQLECEEQYHKSAFYASAKQACKSGNAGKGVAHRVFVGGIIFPEVTLTPIELVCE